MPPSRKIALWTWAVAGAALAVKLVVLGQLHDHPLLRPAGVLDTAAYFQLGQRAAAGDWALGPAAYYVSPLYIYFLVLNGLMVGTYLGVASHWAQAGNISSILMCHGTLELQAIALGGAAGLVLARGFYTPGVWSRKFALRLESARAWRLLAGIFPMLLMAGMLEGFVSPQAPLGGRIACMLASATILIVWAAFGGRERAEPAVAAGG